VKHLLIILSLILLSSPVIGDNHKGETLYLWETSSGVEVWKGFGDKETHSVYKGDVKNGVPHGIGDLTYPDGEKYVGEFKDGIQNGQGTDIFPDGSKYVGEWKNGKHHGQGTYTFHDGVKWVGVWRKSEPWNITKYDKDGKIYGRKVNGVRQ